MPLDNEYDPTDPNSVPRPMSIDDLIRIDQESRRNGGRGIPSGPANFADRFNNMDFRRSDNIDDRRTDSIAKRMMGAVMGKVLDRNILKTAYPNASAFAEPAHNPNSPGGENFQSVMGDQLGMHDLRMAETNPARMKELTTYTMSQDDPAADMVFDVIDGEGDF